MTENNFEKAKNEKKLVKGSEELQKYGTRFDFRIQLKFELA